MDMQLLECAKVKMQVRKNLVNQMHAEYRKHDEVDLFYCRWLFFAPKSACSTANVFSLFTFYALNFSLTAFNLVVKISFVTFSLE